MSNTCYLDINIGDAQRYNDDNAQYQATSALLSKHASTFDFPPTPEELSEEQQDILRDLHCPSSQAGLRFELDPSPGLAKTRQNFISLCTGDKGFCKNAPNKKLHYAGCPIHRVVQGFVAQGGDVTRGDGSGGESIYGPKFACEKAGLQTTPSRGSLAMANSGGKNPVNSSQFFIVLSTDEKALAKLKGKYVIFGRVKDGDEDGIRVLERLDATVESVWIGDCGLE
ncbi:cyclophilin-like domain-containing protein [Desarmillaria tabescens]|uniref:Peptidyl-prolyl cis-trans isomerase n=1 Tax=Armillaria tabescens TaxID=1929756 RepID=A0AA39JKR2_ARMTA|nr:cyclophilin-like domain-containing protein [Desarmillaria tabescens]KAK0444550.1 cyclophilin-like domain-containing protein [Desarmillaria tabescens]